jgi:hypothetical protein
VEDFPYSFAPSLGLGVPSPRKHKKSKRANKMLRPIRAAATSLSFKVLAHVSICSLVKTKSISDKNGRIYLPENKHFPLSNIFFSRRSFVRNLIKRCSVHIGLYATSDHKTQELKKKIHRYLKITDFLILPPSSPWKWRQQGKVFRNAGILPHYCSVTTQQSTTWTFIIVKTWNPSRNDRISVCFQ